MPCLYAFVSCDGTQIAFDAGSGDVIYDSFADTLLRTELETRLVTLNPMEILLPGAPAEDSPELSRHTRRVIEYVCVTSLKLNSTVH